MGKVIFTNNLHDTNTNQAPSSNISKNQENFPIKVEETKADKQPPSSGCESQTNEKVSPELSLPSGSSSSTSHFISNIIDWLVTESETSNNSLGSSIITHLKKAQQIAKD